MKPVLAPLLEQHHPDRRPAVGAHRGHGHGLRGRPSTAAASSNHRPNWTNGSGSTSSLEQWLPTVGSTAQPYRSGRPGRPGSRRPGSPVDSPTVTGTIDVDAERAATPGCATVNHLNNAGAALPDGGHARGRDRLPAATRRSGVATRRPSQVVDRLAAVRSSAARLLHARRRRGGGGRLGHPGVDQGGVGLLPRRWHRPGPARAWSTGSPTTATTSACSRCARWPAPPSRWCRASADGTVGPRRCWPRLLGGRARGPGGAHPRRDPPGSGQSGRGGRRGCAARPAVPYFLDACQSVGQLPSTSAPSAATWPRPPGRKWLRGPQGHRPARSCARDFAERLRPPGIG